MDYNISFKLPDGSNPKYKKTGTMKTGQYGPYVNICIEDMEQALEIAKNVGAKEFKGKHYVNMAMFEKEDKPKYNNAAPQQARSAPEFKASDLDDDFDSIPF